MLPEANPLQTWSYHDTETEIGYIDPSSLPRSKIAKAATGKKDVYTASMPWQWWLDLV